MVAHKIVPPSEEEYPIGSFVEDYVYDPDTVSMLGLILKFDRLQTEVPQYILAYRIDMVGFYENNAIRFLLLQSIPMNLS